jgi:hypothetical protein
MPAMQSTDNAFSPKVWQDHIHAYFDRKLVMGALALVDRTLTAQPGEVVNFPYFKAIGAVETPAQDEGLSVDRLQDDSFSVTIREVGKAVGWKDRAKRTSSQPGAIEGEAQSQIARVYAEKVDSDLVTVMDGSNVAGFVDTVGTGLMNIRNLMKSKITAFGDKSEQAKVCIMHSSDYLNLMTDSTSGFLQANANSPYAMINGYMGMVLNMALIVVDTLPKNPGGSQINSKDVYGHYFLKENPFGIYIGEDLQVEKGRDILAREDVISSTMWYGTLSLHAKINSLDKRVARGICGQG